jgi:hypothetical protein
VGLTVRRGHGLLRGPGVVRKRAKAAGFMACGNVVIIAAKRAVKVDIVLISAALGDTLTLGFRGDRPGF